MRIHSTLLLCALCSWLGCGGRSCGDDAKAASTDSPTASAPPPAREQTPALTPPPAPPPRVEPLPPTDAASVKVLSRGAAPRSALRYHFEPNHAGTFRIDVTTKTQGPASKRGAIRSNPADDGKLVSFVVDVRVTEVDAQGATSLEARVRPSQQGRPAQHGLPTDRRHTLDALVMRWTLSPRGVLLRGETRLPPTTPDEVHGVVDRVRAVLQQLTPPLPEEAVGKGARFSVSRKVSAGAALMLTQTETYQLTASADATLTFDAKLAQSAAKQEALGVGFEQWSGRGKLHGTSSLQRPSFALQSGMTQHIKMTLPKELANVPQNVGVITTSTVHVEAVPAG